MLKSVNLLLVSVVGIFMLSFTSAWTDNSSLYQEVYGCGEMNVTGATYRLIGNLTDNSTADCLTIRADNITINGNGFTVNGNINASNLSNGESMYIAYNSWDNLTLNDVVIEGDVISNGGDGDYAGNGGLIYLTNVSVSSVFSNGGAGIGEGPAGNGGDINITNSTILYIYSLGGNTSGSTPPYAGHGGDVFIMGDSFVGSVHLSGGYGSNGGNSGGNLVVMNSTITQDVVSSGGDSINNGGSGGNITIVFSNISGSIISLGGSGDFGNGGSSGQIIVLGASNLFYSQTVSIYLLGGIGLLYNGTNGNLSLEYFSGGLFFNSEVCDNETCTLITTTETGKIFMLNSVGNISFNILAPTVHLFPQSTSQETNRTFIFNVSDDSNVANCTVYINDDTYGHEEKLIVNESANNSINMILTTNGDAGGNFTAYVNCSDGHFVGQSNTINFTVEETPAEEESSSGSSSGGSAGPTTRSLSDSNFINGFTSNFRKGDSLRFKVSNQTHNLTVNNVSNSSITITIQSTPQTFTLKVGDILNVDVNNDSVKDIEVSYLKYLTSVVSLKVRAIALPYEVPSVKNKTNTSSPYGVGDGASQEGIKDFGKKLFYGLAIILVLVFIAIIVMIVRLLIRTARKKKK